MHLPALSVVKANTLKPIKPRGNVAILWNWQSDVYDKLNAILQTVSPERRHEAGLAAVDTCVLEKVVQALFEYTPAIESAKLLSCDCEILYGGQKRGPNLAEFGAVQDQFVLQVYLEHRFVVWMRLMLAPANALVRSKGELLDAIIRATKELFPPPPTETYSVEYSRDQKRKMVQKEETMSLLDKVPNAQAKDYVLLAMRGLTVASKLGAYPLSSRTIESLLFALRPNDFPTTVNVSKAIGELLYEGKIKHNRRLKLKLEPAGEAEVNRLLSLP